MSCDGSKYSTYGFCAISILQQVSNVLLFLFCDSRTDGFYDIPIFQLVSDVL